MLRDSGDENDIVKAISEFAELESYKDSAEQINICRSIIFERKYKAACALQNSFQEDNLNEAAKIFSELRNYKDSSKRAEACDAAYRDARARRRVREEQEWLAEWELSLKVGKLHSEQASLVKELLSLNNALFAGKRRKEIELRLAQIENELKNL